MYQLSTDSSIATYGAEKYICALKESASVRTLFISGYAPGKPIRNTDVQRCFFGLSAEIVFEERDIAANPRNLFEETASYINEYLEDFIFFHDPSDRYHLFNLQAVRQVAINYPEYFPIEVTGNPRPWLEQNWNLWEDGKRENCIRYGLLSGFPLEAVLNFSEHKERKQQVSSVKQWVHSQVTNLSYYGFNAEKDEEYISQTDEIFIAIRSKLQT
ncbi:MAG TPA: hypothetical protein VFV38_32980 [Ktedonobacteraceae bacterium]|nr:hypothetical protein [Ktedonobacteraceae bacterium]